MERLADALEDRVLHAAAARVVQLEGGVQQQLVRQLLATHAPRKRPDPASAPAVASPAVAASAVAELLLDPREGLRASNLQQLGAQPLNLRVELHLERGVLGLVVRQECQRQVQRFEGVLDAADELRLVGHLRARGSLLADQWGWAWAYLPCLEGPQVCKEQRLEGLGHLLGDLAEGLVSLQGLADLLKGGKQRGGSLEERQLQRAHRLEDVRGAEGDHVAGEEHPHVDACWSQPLR